MELDKLTPNKGSRSNRKRRGRGNASGLGRTSGKGEKGQKARSGGGTRPGFEGGQMPLYRRIPKSGFRSRKEMLGLNQYNIVNIESLEKFDDGTTVDLDALKSIGYGVQGRKRAGIKVLGRGTLSKKLTVKVHAVSAGARKAIEDAGGSIELL